MVAERRADPTGNDVDRRAPLGSPTIDRGQRARVVGKRGTLSRARGPVHRQSGAGSGGRMETSFFRGAFFHDADVERQEKEKRSPFMK
ncbi:hypothetical protein TNIN_443851 [Trichonephila inaurata madagascariensis]|uniref:Uncharacterized protein n=1 Tax=Trichonephila inaurata madagascariensis TaxID=2747483 RepID=A0A8X6JHH8_9ARAC|nr:hypothetical protein TNIN_443851 [Trichonephila inaurata madagascariensis]